MRRFSLLRRPTFLLFCFGLALLALCPTLRADDVKAPSAILSQYRDQRTTWFAVMWPYANTLFGILATIEFAWSAAIMLLERSDLQSWTAALVRKVMWIGAFYSLVLYGRIWIPAIIDSFESIGQHAAGTGPMAPSDVFSRGIDLAAALMGTSSSAAFFTNLGTSLTMVVTGIITALAFIAITVQFVVAMVESYVIVAAAFIFVGFGGSRWTAPYVERYIALGVANGVKIMLLYLLIGTGMDLSVNWMDQASKITTNDSPAMSALEIMGASIIFMMLCWQIPKLFAAVLGGSPALSGGDLIASSTFVAGGAVAVGSAALAGAGALAAGARGLVMAGTSQGSAGIAGLLGSAGSSPSPPTSATSPNSASAPVRPPSASPTARRNLNLRPPSDGAPHAAPPRMNLDHQE